MPLAKKAKTKRDTNIVSNNLKNNKQISKAMPTEPKRCWNTTNPLYIKYHDEEWGVPVHDDRRLFEFLTLDAFQAGLTWLLILQRREDFRRAFDGFSPEKIACYTEADVERLMAAPGVIHNKMKIKATINNAKRFLEVQKEFGSFDVYIWRFVGGKTIINNFAQASPICLRKPSSPKP